MEDVVLKPDVITQWAASHVLVIMDSLEMDLLVMVSQVNHVCFFVMFIIVFKWD